MITIIVAMTEARVIGKDNSIPWKISEELKLFKKLTTGHKVIMGRKTYDSLPMKGGLPNRENIVVTRSKTTEDIEHVIFTSSLFHIVNHMKNIDDEIFVIGGANVYEQALPYADKLSISMVHDSYDGDTFFPEINYDEWELTNTKKYKDFTHNIYIRK